MLHETDDGFLRRVLSIDGASFHNNIMLIVATVQSGEQNTHRVSEDVCGTQKGNVWCELRHDSVGGGKHH
jgi:hypothetical protein